jgi:hypothetical protein
MGPSFKTFSAGSDELLISGWLLSALEFGQLPMNAKDYRDIASRAKELLGGCTVDTLVRLHRDGPRALRDIVENLLDERRVGGGSPSSEAAVLVQRLVSAPR